MAVFDKVNRKRIILLSDISIHDYYYVSFGGNSDALRSKLGMRKRDFELKFNILETQVADLIYPDELERFRMDFLKVERIKAEREYLLNALSILTNPLLTYRNFLLVTNQLANYGFHIDEKQPLKPQIEKVKFHINTLGDEIKIIMLNYQKDDKPEEKDIDIKMRAVYSWAFSLSNLLKMAYKIDLKRETMADWVSYIDMAKKMKNGRFN